MKIKDLTHQQLEKIFNVEPEWVNNRPKWLFDHYLNLFYFPLSSRFPPCADYRPISYEYRDIPAIKNALKTGKWIYSKKK